MSEALERSREDEDRPPEPRPDLSKLIEFLGGPLDVRSLALTGIFVLALVYTLYFARSFLLPIVLAFLLTFLLAPLVRALKRIRIPEGFGAALVILALVSGVVYGAYQLSGPAAAWVQKAPEGVRRAERRIRELQAPVREVRKAAEEVEERVEEMAGGDDVREVQVQGRSLSGALLSQTQSFLAGGVVMLILLYFLLASGDLFLRKLVKVLPRLKDKKAAIEIARATEHHISAYLSTVTLINIGLGVVVGVAMSLVGMPNPVLWGVTAGVLNFVPYLGPIVMLGVLAIVSLLTFEDLARAAVAPLVYFGINMVEGYFVTPALLGRRLILNPVVIFLALIFWGWMWGIAGALLAVPLLAILKIFCDHIEPLAPIGEFLGR
jgi:predicted PurR-regulated permease PerM